MDTRSAVRAFALAGLLVIALAPAGCGGSDGGGGDATASVASTPEEQALLAAREDLRAAFFAGDAKKYCSGLTPETRRNEGRFMGKDCEGMIKTIFPNPDPDNANSSAKAKVVSVEVDGDRGVVKAREPGIRKPVATTFAKRDGRWLGDWRMPTKLEQRPDQTASP